MLSTHKRCVMYDFQYRDCETWTAEEWMADMLMVLREELDDTIWED